MATSSAMTIGEKMKKKRNLYRFLSNIASGIIGRTVTVQDVPVLEADSLGYTLKGDNIYVAYNHFLYDGISEEEKDVMRLGVTVHEALHQVFTNFEHAEYKQEKLKREGYFTSRYDEWLYHQILNLVEDPAIETAAPEVVGGDPLKALKFMIITVDSRSDYSHAPKDEIEEITKALIQFGDVGLVRDYWTFEEARKVFLKIAPLFYDAVNDPDNKSRIDRIPDIHKELRVLYRKDAKPEGSLSRTSTPEGKGSGKKGKSSSEDSELNRKRKISIKRVKRDEWEKMKKEAEENPSELDDGESDLTIVIPEDLKPEDMEKKEDNKEEGASVPVTGSKEEKDKEGKSNSKSSHVEGEEEKEVEKEKDSLTETESSSTPETREEKSDKKKEDTAEEKSDSKSNSDSDFESESNDESKESSDSSEEKGKEGEKEGENKKEKTEEGKKESSDKTEGVNPSPYEGSEEGAENPFELSDEEMEILSEDDFELSVEELEKIAENIESYAEISSEGEDDPSETDKERETREMNDKSDMVAKELHTGAKCNNHIEVAGAPYEAAYESFKEPYEADIEMLQDELREIFDQDETKTYYARSGRVSLKRMINRSASTRLFERTERSTGKEDIAIYMMVDMSGSTQFEGKIEQERLTAVLIAEALSAFNIPLYITGFTDYENVELFHFVRWDNTEEERQSLLNIRHMWNNFDAYAVRYAEEALKERNEKRKLFIMISDGQPASYFSGGEAGIRQNAQAVQHMKEAGIDVLAFGVGSVPDSTFETMYGKESYINVSNPTKLFENLSRVLRNLIDGEDKL